VNHCIIIIDPIEKGIKERKVHWSHNCSNHYWTIRFCCLSFNITMVSKTNNVWRLFWTLIHEWFCTTFIHLYIIHTILVFRNNNNNNNRRNNNGGKQNIYIYIGRLLIIDKLLHTLYKMVGKRRRNLFE